MRTVTDILNDVNAVYYDSLDCDRLLEGEKTLAALMRDAYVNEKNRNKALSLQMRMTAKRLLLEYIGSSYSIRAMEDIFDFAEDNAPVAREKGFVKTAQALDNVVCVARDISALVGDAAIQKARVMSEDNLPMSSSKTECAQVAAIFAEKANKAKSMLIPDPMFNKGVKFVDIRERLVAEFEKVADFAQKTERNIRERDARVFIEGVRELRASTDWQHYAYYPAHPEWKGARSAIILNTPYRDEAGLAVVRNCDCPVYEVRSDMFAGKDAGDLECIFAQFAARGGAVLITDLESFRGGITSEVIDAACNYAAAGRGAFLTDGSGECLLGRASARAAKVKLPLPSKETVKKAFEENGLTFADGDIPEKFAFMGYEGINLAVRDGKKGKDFRAVLDWLCDDVRRAYAYGFLRSAKTQQGFIPDDWGDFYTQAENLLGGKIRFRYECFPEELRGYIEQTVRSTDTTQEKCAKFFTYIFDCDNSQEKWVKKSTEEKQKALTLAVRFVMQVLGTGIVPDVQFLDDLGPGHKNAGGLCCDGGKIIKFRNDGVDNLSYIADAVAHECLHSLQHTAERTGWQPWMWEELGITEGRIENWTRNSYDYNGIDENFWAYRVQIMEADANAFAKECTRFIKFV